jgi:uncharacterized protein YndB with AHSA1/START domain
MMPAMPHALTPVDDTFFQTAPIVIPSVVELDAPPERVWEALGSDRMWSWFGGIDQLQWLTPHGAGAIRRLRLAKLTTIDEEFYRWEAPHRATFRVTQTTRPLLNGLAEDFVLEEVPGGRTKLTWTMALDAKLPGAQLLKPVLTRGNQQAIAGIKKIL